MPASAKPGAMRRRIRALLEAYDACIREVQTLTAEDDQDRKDERRTVDKRRKLLAGGAVLDRVLERPGLIRWLRRVLDAGLHAHERRWRHRRVNPHGPHSQTGTPWRRCRESRRSRTDPELEAPPARGGGGRVGGPDRPVRVGRTPHRPCGRRRAPGGAAGQADHRHRQQPRFLDDDGHRDRQPRRRERRGSQFRPPTRGRRLPAQPGIRLLLELIDWRFPR